MCRLMSHRFRSSMATLIATPTYQPPDRPRERQKLVRKRARPLAPGEEPEARWLHAAETAGAGEMMTKRSRRAPVKVTRLPPFQCYPRAEPQPAAKPARFHAACNRASGG